jgi:glycosyltransferase involved in cell wall biosynthesis
VGDVRLSVVIRTLNESRYLDELLSSVRAQSIGDHELEIVVIDSGSSDATLEIAESHGCRITHISKAEFSFGRSLNMGSQFATGDVLIYVSGHCVPCDDTWLQKLVEPLLAGKAEYVYGRQIGRDSTRFSERKLFEKYYPPYSKVPQPDFFCNNANSAILRETWQRLRFEEALTGLEDLELAKRLHNSNGAIAYVAEAPVYHIHDESWAQVRRRYEREAIALQQIMPEVHITFGNFLRYLTSAIFFDAAQALAEMKFLREISGIIRFRFAQYRGSYRGNHEHRKLSQRRKERYFFPGKS